jgi:uncharacterized protein YyaL (SSP411 family)
LLQHAYNPVDWWPWCPEALAKAQEEDKPILLSIGYSACHWCHVMEHESFENAEVAHFMNEHFIPIKVDREERPDLDEIYMKAVQLMTGHGGWPMTVFLTPQLKPFFGGTYYPPEDRHGLPGFKRLLLVLAQTWREQRDKLHGSADELTNYLSLMSEVDPGGAVPGFSVIERCMDRMVQVFDRTWGGFGGAPKFPQTFTLELAMRQAAPGSRVSPARRKECMEIVNTTLDRMAYGGMHDQLGGGFSRYSVDRQWRVPHFEKMLYDNATLSKAYLDGFLLTGRKYWRKVAGDTLDFVVRELRTQEGAFFSSLDADSEGEEGKFYVWRPEEIISSLGDDDGRWFNEVFSVSKIGSFEHGTSVLMLSASPEELAQRYGISQDQFWSRISDCQSKLMPERDKRVRPARDEKVLTSWNALMISSFVHGYRVLQDERYLKVARDAADFLLEKLCVKGRLLRTWGAGKAKLNAYLDDYSYLVKALLDLGSVDFEKPWLDRAAELANAMIKHFWDDAGGGFFYTSDDHEQLITRTKTFYDGSTPSATSVAAGVLLRLAVLTGDSKYRQKAEKILQLYCPHAEKAPDQFANLLCLLDYYLAEQSEIAFLFDGSHSDWQPLLYLIHSYFLPATIHAVKSVPKGAAADKKKSSKQKSLLDKSPLFKDRSLVEGKPTAYLCRNYSCERPITEKSLLEQKLAELAGAQK